jgi:hypothetical protein
VGPGVWFDPENPAGRALPSPHVELFGNFTISGPNIPSGFLDMVQLQQSHRVPIHFVQSSVVLEDSPLSRVYTDFRDAARQLIAGGTPLTNILGSADYTNVDLFFRDRQSQDPFSASFWACEMLKSFEEMDDLVKLGTVALLTPFMRVCIFSCFTSIIYMSWY